MAPDYEDEDYLKGLLEKLDPKQAKVYLEDPAGWLQDRFTSVLEEIRDQITESGEWQNDQMKSFMQDAAELQWKNRRVLETSFILWLGIVAIIAMTLSGFWIGAAGVLVVTGLVYWGRSSENKGFSNVVAFREKARDLLKETEDISSQMLAEDKLFLQKCKDGVLFPLAIPPNRRKDVSLSDLWDIETLYLEYRGHTAHYGHRSSNTPEDCKLCKSARRVREHIQGVLSKFEADVESTRRKLIAQIDNNNEEGAIRTKDFLEDFLRWEERCPGDFPRRRHSRNYLEDCWRYDERCRKRRDCEDKRGVLLKPLGDKDRWTFKEADAVRELCGWKKWRINWDWRDLSEEIYYRLTIEMKSAAGPCGLEEQWEWYDRQNQWGLMAIRRAIGRREPEAMFRELCRPSGLLRSEHFSLLKEFASYGYDSKMLDQEITTAKKLIAKEGGWK